MTKKNTQSQHDLEEERKLTTCVFEHYIKHHEVVLKKIQHARTATNQSLKEYDNIQEDKKSRNEIKDIKEYDSFWQELIKLFREAGISREGLQKIENVILNIPKMIKKYYDVLISQDKPLLMLIKELKSKKYKDALKAIKNIKDASDELSFDDLDNYRAQDNRTDYILRKAETLAYRPHTQS